VLIQSVRMMRSLKVVQPSALAEMVTALDNSTREAQTVLAELRRTLADCSGTARVVADGKAICDELTVMIGIANASADRMADAAEAARRRQNDEQGDPYGAGRTGGHDGDNWS
jgi:hypothetical protein